MRQRAMEGSGISDYYATERPELVSFISQCGTFDAAIDIGCAGGRMGVELIQSSTVARCDGIEPFPDAAEMAQKVLRNVWQGTLEAVMEEVPWESYDLVTLADVLEHLVDPWAMLRILHARTSPACRLALSVPNVRHYKVVLPLLLRGEFRYEDQGIMDRTHLHFFTRGSLIEALEGCGWRLSKISAHMKKKYQRWFYPTRLIEPFVTVQYLLVAEKQ